MYAWSYAGVIVGSIELWCKVYVGAPSGAINAYAPLIPIAAEAAPTESVTSRMHILYLDVLTPRRLQYEWILHCEHNGLTGRHRCCPYGTR